MFADVLSTHRWFGSAFLAFVVGSMLWLSTPPQSAAKPTPPPKAPSSGSLTILIQGLRNNDGRVSLTLYNRADGYPMKPKLAFAKRDATIQNKQVRFVFPALPCGTYAVAAYHDENANGKLDTNWIGIPREGTAASNNAKGFMGPPKFRDARFHFKQTPLTVFMKVNY